MYLCVHGEQIDGNFNWLQFPPQWIVSMDISSTIIGAKQETTEVNSRTWGWKTLTHTPVVMRVRLVKLSLWLHYIICPYKANFHLSPSGFRNLRKHGRIFEIHNFQTYTNRKWKHYFFLSSIESSGEVYRRRQAKQTGWMFQLHSLWTNANWRCRHADTGNTKLT